MFNLVTASTAAAAEPVQGVGGLISFVPMILIFVAMFYFMFRSQKKQAKKRQEMIDTIVKGAEVIIGGGIHGTVVAVKDKTFTIQIADKVNVEVTKAGVNGIMKEESSCCAMSK
ncbi:MAG: preprotein translocase subunit YajC [Victivallales bacterium]|nr:preprotein translocase subunit YajC [Victivallales bacterium]